MSLTFKILTSIVIITILGFFSGMVTQSSITTWYVDLQKPFFNPPNWIFGPVWTLLYIMMGVSFGIVWHKVSNGAKGSNAIILYLFQFILNLLWSLIFFGLKNPTLALVDIILLLIMIATTIITFKKLDKTAAYLLIPYLLWVSFATILNASIVYLNS